MMARFLATMSLILEYVQKISLKNGIRSSSPISRPHPLLVKPTGNWSAVLLSGSGRGSIKSFSGPWPTQRTRYFKFVPPRPRDFFSSMIFSTKCSKLSLTIPTEPGQLVFSRPLKFDGEVRPSLLKT
jgi:hypothetical protein